MKTKKILFGSLIILLAAVLWALCSMPGKEAPQPEPAPVIEPTPTPEQTEPEKAPEEKVLEQMSLREKICQMLIVTPESLAGVDTATIAGPLLSSGIKEYPVGGMVFFAGNIISKEQFSALALQGSDLGEIPMFLAVDQEGGKVARLNENVGFPVFKSMYEYKDEGKETAYENAKTMAENMKQLGLNLDFAPVADVWSNTENTVIGKRAYSDDFEEASVLVESAVKGFHDGGMICTLKHFPGHGNTYVDTHDSLAYVSKTKDELNKQEILPFKSGIKAGADMVMIGHLVVEDIDNENPATLSKAVVTDYLKTELGYEGIVITDSLAMGAVSESYTSGQLSVKAVKAGVDILLMPKNIKDAVSSLEEAVKNGEISEERINESVRKILALKLKYQIIKNW